jgi:hypothetical protein
VFLFHSAWFHSACCGSALPTLEAPGPDDKYLISLLTFFGGSR